MRSRALAISAQRPAHNTLLAALAGLGALGALAAGLALPQPAHAQVFSSTPYVAAPDPAVEQLRNRLNAIEGDLKQATDRAEKLGFDLAQTRRTAEEAKASQAAAEQKLVDLALRLEALEAIARGTSVAGSATLDARSAGAPADSAAAGGGARAAQLVNRTADVSALPQDEDGLLKESRNLLLDGNYPAAQGGFSAFLAKFPKSSNAHEAQYMLGDALLYQNNYGDAVTAYQTLINDHPSSANGPNALVKLARSLRLMNKKPQACQVLDLMPKQYPKAPAQAKQTAATERDRASCK